MPQPGEKAQASGTTDAGGITAVLGAFSFFLSAIEYTFPKPLPFIRLGIANLPLLLAVDILPLPSYLLLALVKFAGMGLVSGTLLSYVAIFSLAGSMAAALAMRATRFLFRGTVTHVGISIAGAMTSAMVQISLARWLVFGAAAWAIAPLYLGMSLVTGTLLGLFALKFTSESRWYASLTGGTVLSGEAPAVIANFDKLRGVRKSRLPLRPLRWDAGMPPASLAIAGAIVALSLMFQPNLAIKGTVTIALALLLFLSGKRIKPVTSLVVVASIVLANLAIPVGRVLARIGPLVVTETALLEGIGKALVFEGLLFVSRLSLKPGLRFPGRLGRSVGEAFETWQRIVELGPRVRPATFVADADALLSELGREVPRSGPDEKGSAEASLAKGDSRAAMFRLGGAVCVALAALVLGLVLGRR